MSDVSAANRVRFGAFELDTHTQELRRDGRALRVRPQSLKLLRLLVSRRGELVTREAIHQELWGADTFVDFEQGVNHGIRELRSALGDVADAPRFIETLPRRGYRFIAPVDIVPAAETPSLPPTPDVGPPDAQPVVVARVSRFWKVAIAGVATAAVLAAVYLFRPVARPPLTPASAIVVAPFSATAGDEALGIGLADAIQMRFAEQLRLPLDPGRTAGTLTLAGDIEKAGDDVVVNTQLRDAAGGVLWSDRLQIRARELFSIENVVAGRVVDALNLQLAAREQDRLRRRYTDDAAAYEQYLRGRAALVRYTPEDTRRAVSHFERALEIDASYALARAGLAMAAADMYLRFSPPSEVEQWGERADQAARDALASDPDLAEAHLARAAIARKREFDWNATVVSSRRAITLNPTLEQAHFFTAAAYYHLGYMEESLIALEQGRRLQGPDEIESVRIEALVALFGGRFTPARTLLQEVSRRSSQSIGDTYLALAYYYTGSTDQGIAMLTNLASHRTAATAARAGAALAGVLAAEGQAARARDVLARVVSGDYRDHHVAYSFGAAYAQLGDHAAAVRWLRTAADTGFPCLVWFERDPLLQPVRAVASWTELLTHVRRVRESSLSSVDR